jgi:hypothetical protein
MSVITLKDIVTAAKLDILKLLEGEKPHTFEFRRVGEVCDIMIDVCNSFGHPAEHGTLSSAAREAETKAPTLHSVLMGRAFDGNALLREKYEELTNSHTRLRKKALDIADARAKVAQGEAVLEMKNNELSMRTNILQEYEARLERERERLQLTAGEQGVEIDLPDLPQLPDDFGKHEDEDEPEQTQEPVADAAAVEDDDSVADELNYR